MNKSKYGWINDYSNSVTTTIEGKQKNYYWYVQFTGMHYRIFKPEYTGVKISHEFYSLANFKQWYDQEIQKNIINEKLVLDKDIFGNSRLYSPNTCCLVTVYLNNFLKINKLKQNNCILWVRKRKNKYQCEVKLKNKIKFLGSYVTEKDAFLIAANYKKQIVKNWPFLDNPNYKKNKLILKNVIEQKLEKIINIELNKIQ